MLKSKFIEEYLYIIAKNIYFNTNFCNNYFALDFDLLKNPELKLSMPSG